jgi:metal-sulfur cluster biosynthetic enzyme
MNDPGIGAAETPPFPYDGPQGLREPIVAALTQVVDPEVALSIVDVGLVYGVTVSDTAIDVALTMTSAACPVADLIVDEAIAELEPVAEGREVRIGLVWSPPWGPERMSARARRFMNG